MIWTNSEVLGSLGPKILVRRIRSPKNISRKGNMTRVVRNPPITCNPPRRKWLAEAKTWTTSWLYNNFQTIYSGRQILRITEIAPKDMVELGLHNILMLEEISKYRELWISHRLWTLHLIKAKIKESFHPIGMLNM